VLSLVLVFVVASVVLFLMLLIVGFCVGVVVFSGGRFLDEWCACDFVCFLA
jgi:hypothetical protein